MLEQIDMFAEVSNNGENGRTGYDADDIQVLEGLVAVRKRPGMYIGSTSSSGLHHLVWEIVDNAVDEHLAKYCTKIDILLRKDGSVTVSDNGRGSRLECIRQGYLHRKLYLQFCMRAVSLVDRVIKNQAVCMA